MTFTPKEWKNTPSKETPISAAALIDAETRLSAYTNTRSAEFLPVFHVKAYSAKGDGSTDDSTAIQNAINAANEAGGGIVFFPAGTFIVGTALALKTNVWLCGTGNGSIIKLKNGANTHVLTTYKLGENGQDFYRVTDLRIDGNKSNNATGGNGIYSDGRRVVMERLAITNCNEHGLAHKQTASNFSNGEGGSDSYFRGIFSYSNNKCGILNEGHDSEFTTCRLAANTEAGLKTAGSGFATLLNHVHSFGAQEYAFNFEASFDAINCEAEGASLAQVRCKSGGRWTGGRAFVAGSPTNVCGFLIVENTTELHTYNVAIEETGTGGAFKAGGSSAGSGSILNYHFKGGTSVAFTKAEGASWSGNIQIEPTHRGSVTFGEPPGPNTVASATTLPTLTSNNRYFHLTGTAEVKEIPVTYPGHLVTLVTTSTAKLIQGGNLRISGTFTGANNASITLECDGSTWVEIGRGATNA